MALGRGLNALIPEATTVSENASNEDLMPSKLYKFEDKAQRLAGRVADIETTNIRPNPYQPRRDFDESALEDLASSIRELGIIQPITVRALPDDKFELISGERRWRASRRAGLKRIPAYIREADNEAMLEMAIVENVQREDLNPIDIALGYERLIEECGLTQEQVSVKVSKNRTTVTNYLRLLRLPPPVQASLRDGSISAGHARALLGLEEQKAQIDVLKEILDKGLSVRQVEERVKELNHPAAEVIAPVEAIPQGGIPSVDELQIQDFGNRLRSFMSTKVEIKHKSDGNGRIEINYYSKEDLERLLDLILNSNS